jgi:hypothetical protein
MVSRVSLPLIIPQTQVEGLGQDVIQQSLQLPPSLWVRKDFCGGAATDAELMLSNLGHGGCPAWARPPRVYGREDLLQFDAQVP